MGAHGLMMLRSMSWIEIILGLHWSAALPEAGIAARRLVSQPCSAPPSEAEPVINPSRSSPLTWGWVALSLQK